MMGDRRVDQAALFYEFSLERHVPSDHLLRAIDRFVDLDGVRAHLAPFYSSIGRPSIDPELLIRMLLVGYCFGIRSERRLCEEVHLNLKADANRQRCVPGTQGLPPEAASRAIDEYLAALDDAAFGAATPVTPKFISPADPASRWTGANKGLAFFAYCTNYLIDLDHAVIVDVEASTAVRPAELTAARTMIERVREQHELSPQRLSADSAYGSAEMLDWLVNDQDIEPHIPVIDKSERVDGTFSRRDFTYDAEADLYRCPGGKELKQHRRAFRIDHPDVPPDDTYRYRASKADCDACSLRSRCCPNAPARKVTRSIYEAARDRAREIATTDAYIVSRRERKKVEMLFAHLKRILKLDRLRLRGPCGARDEFLLAATAQNLRKLAKLIPPPAIATA
ncbi:transposase [Phenylobacterium sp.]|uniref:transposase n=1 Tax=Phenylobacterium sp. TaxID=1871053 RepID=UPI0035B4011E